MNCFVWVINTGLISFFSICTSVFQEPLVEDAVLSWVYVSSLLVKYQMPIVITIHVSVFYLIPLRCIHVHVYVSVCVVCVHMYVHFVPIPHWFYSYSSMNYLELWNNNPSSINFFSSELFWLSRVFSGFIWILRCVFNLCEEYNNFSNWNCVEYLNLILASFSCFFWIIWSVVK